MLYVVLAVLLGLLGVLWFITQRPERRGKRLPGPTGLPILGCLLDLTPENMLNNMEKYAQQYGSSFEFMSLSTRIVVSSDPEVTRDATVKRPKVFRRPDSMEHPGKVLGVDKGLFIAEGKDWGRARRLTAPSFSHSNLAALDCGNQWLAKLKDMAGPDGVITAEGMHLFELFTATVLIRAAFGDDVDGTYLETSQFFKDMNTLLLFLTNRILWPLPEWTWRLLPLPSKIFVRLAARRMNQSSMELILKARERVHTDDSQGQGNEGLFIKSLMRARDSTATDNARDGLSNEDLLAQIKTFLVAGSETTSTVLTWILKELATKPQLCEKIRAEVSELLKKTGGEWPRTMSELDELKWSEATFREAVRLYSPAPMLFFTAIAPTELPNGVWLQPEDLLLVRTEHVQKDEKVFESPLEFRPERWLNSPSEEMLNAAALTFGGGPRVCPGMRLAYGEGIIALAMVAHHYDVQLQCDSSEVNRVFFFTTRSTKMPIKLVPRQI